MFQLHFKGSLRQKIRACVQSHCTADFEAFIWTKNMTEEEKRGIEADPEHDILKALISLFKPPDGGRNEWFEECVDIVSVRPLTSV